MSREYLELKASRAWGAKQPILVRISVACCGVGHPKHTPLLLHLALAVHVSLHVLWEIGTNPEVAEKYQQGVCEEPFLGAKEPDDF